MVASGFLVDNVVKIVVSHGDKSVHGRVFVVFPSQGFPPFSGAGLLHSLVDVWEPNPQVALQEEYGFHGDHPPSTGHRG